MNNQLWHIYAKTSLFNLEKHDKKKYLTPPFIKQSQVLWSLMAGTIWWGHGLSNPLHFQIFEGVTNKNPDYLALHQLSKVLLTICCLLSKDSLSANN